MQQQSQSWIIVQVFNSVSLSCWETLRAHLHTQHSTIPIEREKRIPHKPLIQENLARKRVCLCIFLFQEIAKWSFCFLISATILILILMVTVMVMMMGLASTIQWNGDHHLGWIPITTHTRSSIYNKEFIAECMAEDAEGFEMNTKINKRILAINKHIESWIVCQTCRHGLSLLSLTGFDWIYWFSSF